MDWIAPVLGVIGGAAALLVLAGVVIYFVVLANGFKH